MPGPLQGLRVLDIGTRIGAPFCAGLLGEWGAQVIKIEQPGTGDFMRGIGPFHESGASFFWAVEGRGRLGATCDLRTKRGQQLFRRLAEGADVVCENFKPGTLEGWGLAPSDLDPRIVFVRISAFGQDGPYSKRPGLDRLGVAYGGLMHLTGEPDRPPVRPGVTVADYLTGVFAAEAALAALYRRDADRGHSGADLAPGHEGRGHGAIIDASLYGSVLRILEWTIAAYDSAGIVRSREGNRLSNSAPLDNYPTVDGRFVCIVAGSDANFARLCKAMSRDDLLEDARFRTLKDRAENSETINAIVAQWTSTHTAADIEGVCVVHDVPVATAYSAVDIAGDPHFAARGDLVKITDPVIGPMLQQAPYPRLVGEEAAVPSGAPALGADNVKVWCDIVGLSSQELQELQNEGVV